MVYARAAELDELLSLVRSGRSAALVGLHGSGRSELLRRAIQDLEATGVRVVGNADLDGARARPVGAAPAARPSGRDTDPGRRVAALRAEVAATSRAVMVLDDADLIDEGLRTIAESLLSEGLPFIIVLRPGGRPPTDFFSRSTASVTPVRLAPLSFDAVADLLDAEFDMRANPELVARLTMKSAGNPGLARSIVETGVRVGLIAQQGDTWTMTSSSLWHRSLSAEAERYLSSLSDAEYQAIYGLALASATPLSQCLEFTSEEAITALSRRALVTVLGDELGAMRIAVSPPLLSDYFRHLPRTVERELILARMPEGMRHRVATTVNDSEEKAHDRSSSDAAIARFFEDQAISEETLRWERWSTDHSLENGLRYLEMAFTSTPDETRLRVVLDETRLASTATAEQVGEFVTYRAVLGGLASGTADGAREAFESARRVYPALSMSFAAGEALVSVLLGDAGVQRIEELSSLLDRTDSRDARSVIHTAIALCHAIAGEGRKALQSLSHASATKDPVATLVGELASGLALFSLGHLSQMLENSGRGLEKAKNDLDLPGIIVHGYLVVLALVRLGKWANAEQVLGFILSLGHPPRIFSWVYGGMARLSALLAARSGNPRFAEELLEMADRFDPATSMMPGAQPEISSAVHLIIAQNDRSAGQAMALGAERCEQRGYLLSALSLLLYAVCLDPTPHVCRDLERVAARGDRSHEPFAHFASAVVAEPGEAPSCALAYELDADVFLAILLLRTLAERESNPAGPYAEALQTLEQRSHWVSADAFFPNGQNTVAALTGRELEVARLAGTMTNAEIAGLLHVSVSTVANHVSSALKKSGSASRRELFDLVRQSDMT